MYMQVMRHCQVVRTGATYIYDFFPFTSILPQLEAIPTGFALYDASGTPLPSTPNGSLNGTLALESKGNH